MKKSLYIVITTITVALALPLLTFHLKGISKKDDTSFYRCLEPDSYDITGYTSPDYGYVPAPCVTKPLIKDHDTAANIFIQKKDCRIIDYYHEK